MKSSTLLLFVCAAAAAQSARADNQTSLAAIQAACAGDAQKLCAGVQPGGGRIVACLKEHKDELSDQCKQAAGVPINSNGGSAPGATAAAPSAAAPSAAARKTVSAKGTKATGKEKFKES